MPADIENDLPASLRSLTIAQVALIVPDLDSALRQWSLVLGRSDWYIVTYGPDNVARLTYQGEPGNCRFRLAFAGRAPQIELIEPLRGPSIYHDWVAERGYGLHHLGFRVPSVQAAMDRATADGIKILQSGQGYGLDGDGGFAYLDTQERLGVILEAIEVPRRRRPSLSR